MWRVGSRSARAARAATVLPAPTSPVMHAEGVFTDAPADAGDGFGVAAVAVQHAGGQVAAEGHAGEAVVGCSRSMLMAPARSVGPVSSVRSVGRVTAVGGAVVAVGAARSA